MAWTKKNWTKKPVVKKSGFRLKQGSEQQEALWNVMVNSTNHILGKALAGTGKTSSSIEGLHRIIEAGTHSRMGMVAFNKSIATELQEKVPTGVVAGTLHSLGLKACNKRMGRVKVDFDKVERIATPLVEVLTNNFKLQNAYLSVIRKTVSLVKNLNYDVESFDESVLNDLYGRFGYESDDLRVSATAVVDATRTVLNRSIRDNRSIDFDDMLWLPVKNNWLETVFDFVVVDESQDLNPIQQLMVQRMAERYMVVGDENQSIYAFRGADCDSMNTMYSFLRSLGEVSVLPLTKTRRCPKSHVKLNQSIVSEFEALPDAVEGVIRSMDYKDSLNDMTPGSLVMCRKNAPMCLAAVTLLKAKKPVRIPGNDLKGEIIRLLNRFDTNDMQQYQIELGAWFEKQVRRVQNDPSRLRVVEEKYQCVLAFCDGVSTVDEAKRNVQQVFVPDDYGNAPNEIICSSVHRAKGLEADTTYILIPEMMPAPWAKTDQDKKQEMNIKYVAQTRSKNTMVFVPDWL